MPGLFATILSTLVLALFFVERTGYVVNDAADGIAVALFFVHRSFYGMRIKSA